MSATQNSQLNLTAFIDYVPAEVQATKGNNWLIVYYVKEPSKLKMKRFRHRVKKMSNKTLRMRYAKKMCSAINNKLEKGWSPFFEGDYAQQYKTLDSVINTFLEQAERKHRDNLLRKESLRAYKSYFNNLKQFIDEKGLKNILAVEFDKTFVIDFLDYIYFDRKRSARTHNNYLNFLNQFGIFLNERKIIPANPANGIPKRKVGKKKREIIPGTIKNEIFKFLAVNNITYLTLCLTVYFCFIRRTEISKLQVKHVNLIKDTIFIPSYISKNKKDGIVTIPNKLKKLFIKHLEGSENDMFLFSGSQFKPGYENLKPRKISGEWAKMRNALKFKNEYQFYSLKDSGITQLFLLNVPLIKIRDQARHYDIKITETYAPRNYKADEFLRDLDFNF